ncbi:MAG TPA: sigma-70 family RNA polymerase sigma factor [Tepidisphaeraceae bacterium]|jgi:RNA polymerase sigma-70 factor (ECF subfamily)|nr:sigma-70 family RNA polymerase sigma factor [Tepidisphaeraceae bacterium]
MNEEQFFSSSFIVPGSSVETIVYTTPVPEPPPPPLTLGSRASVSSSERDLALLRAMAEGDAAAFGQFYDRHAGLVFALCLRILHNRAEAEDLMIDIFYELWNRIGRFDATRGSPLTYLTMLARSRAIDRKRSLASSGKNEPIVDESDAATSETPLDDALTGERRRIVRQALRELDPAQRQAIESSFYDGLSHSEIAAKLNKPLGTVKTSIRQGLIRLRDSLRSLSMGTLEGEAPAEPNLSRQTAARQAPRPPMRRIDPPEGDEQP